jgi:signal peptidase II
MILKNKYAALMIIAGLVIGLDQITKLLILRYLPLYDVIPIIPGFLDIIHLQNPGVAFGMFSANHSNIQQIVLMSASLVAVCVIFYFYSQTTNEYRFMLLGFALIFGGAIGNFIDRIRMGRVVDFIDVYIGNLHWPAFNVADSAISIGIAIFLYHMIFKRPDFFFDQEGAPKKGEKS